MNPLELFQGPFYQLGILVWNAMLALIGAVATETPMSFSEGAWGYVVLELYPWTLAIGSGLLNILFFVGFFRQAGNLKQNITTEALVESGIRLIFANALMVSGVQLQRLLFRMAGALAGDLLIGNEISFSQEDLDSSSSLFYFVFGLFFLITCLVCSGMVFLAVYGRYLQLYLLVVCGPLALSALPGGPGVASTSFAWLRTFLAKTFEIVLIALVLVIGARMCSAIDFGSFSGIAGIFDGALQALQSMATMILLTASVKGADSFLRRTFAL